MYLNLMVWGYIGYKKENLLWDEQHSKHMDDMVDSEGSFPQQKKSS